MNRPIKFRFWDKVIELFVTGEGYAITASGVIIGRNRASSSGGDIYYNCNPEDVVVQQFTGLKDKNGKDIYEGDIVRFYDNFNNTTMNGFITYLQDQCTFVAQLDKSDVNNFYYLFGCLNVEIVGNIFENPELL